MASGLITNEASHRTRSHRVFRLLRWTVLTFAVVFALLTAWFIFRIEKFILDQLPSEVRIGTLSVSFFNRKFVLSDVQIYAKEKGACDGRVLVTAARIDGSFHLRARKLHTLTASALQLTKDAFDRRCLEKPKVQSDYGPRRYIADEGLVIDVKDAMIPGGNFGTLRATSVITAKYLDERDFQIAADRLQITGTRLSIDGRKIHIDFRQNTESNALHTASGTFTARYSDLSKLPKLSNRKFSVRSGEAELKLTASYAGSEWMLFTAVELKGVRVSGQPLYNMPMGLLQLTPENMWPMAEDAPGVLAFQFKTLSTTPKLGSTYAADIKIALRNKIRGNLKKKIPVLPF